MKEHLFPSHIAQVNSDCDLRKRGRKEGLPLTERGGAAKR